MLGLYIVLGVLFILILLMAKFGFRTVPQSHVMIVERLGKFSSVLKSGLHLIIPLWDKPRRVVNTSSVSLDARRLESKGPTRDEYQAARVVDSQGSVSRTGQFYWSDFVDLREQILDFPQQRVITKDNLMLTVDAVLYYQITDPVKSAYEVENLPLAIEKLTQTSLRTAIGALELDETLDSRDTINNRLRTILDEATDKWGVKVTRVELQDIAPPTEIREAMQKQVTAERQRRADVIEAEGKKQADITRAEGDKQANITRAEGQREAAIKQAEGLAKARLLEAEAESVAISNVWDKLKDKTPTYLLVRGYIKALEAAVSEPGS